MIKELAAPDAGKDKKKEKYEGVLNNAGEVLKAYCWAFSPSQAKKLILDQLGQKMGLTADGVRQRFSNRVLITRIST